MKPQKSFRFMAFFLSIIIMVQSFGFVPVFAAGTNFSYILNYEEEAYISQEHPIIIPDGDIDPEYGAEAHYPFNSNDEGISITTGNAISDWGPDPYRIIGYTFMGWYTEPEGEGTKVDENTVITDDMLGAFNILNLYGHWVEYNSPDITTDSLVISAKNEQKENLDDVTLTYSQGSATGFVNDVTEYYAEVFGDTHYLTLDFEQYEPTAVTSVKFNGTDVALDSNKKEILTTTAYWFDDNANLIGSTVNTGIKLGTTQDSIVLDITSDAQEYNVIEITVKLPETNPVSERTYTIHIKRLKMELDLNYGNTPYGRIMKNDILTDEEKDTAKADFDSTFVYRNNTYTADAWNPYGADGVEVIKGTVLSGKQYINYDKDDTAIVVYSGDSFVDPGVTLYNDRGEKVVLSDSDYITRTITYEKVSSLRHENWSSVTSATDVSTLTGDDSDYVVDVLKENEVKPGVYTINYSYTSDDTTVSADRNMIVLPKLGDVNMDNYVNALDTAVYDMEISADSISNCLYKYRALDVNIDGSIDSTDKEYLKAGTTIKELYTSLSEDDSVVQSTYTVTEADNTKAQLYMDFLGTDSSDLSAAVDATEQLEQGDVFWIGYRFANSSIISSDTETVTLAVNYDSRYIAPDADDLSALITVINANNPDLAVFNIEGISDIAAKYTYDSSTSQCTWQDEASIKTLLLEMYLKDDESFTLQDGYFIKLPFAVNVLPPSDGRKIISTQLGANTLNMIDASDNYGLMWDTSDSLNSVTENLMSKMQYMGDYVPVFGEEAEATLLPETAYGATVNIVISKFNKGTLEGTLPEGLTYSKSLNKISGAPEETGTFEFYIDGVKYSIIVNKAELKVSADNKTKAYGDANPTLTYTYDESCLKNGDTVADAVQTEPAVTCDATEKTPYESVVPITLSGGASDNYYFTFTDGTLTVDKQRELNITAISKIPVCTAQIISDNNSAFPITITTTAQSPSDFTAAEILAGDNVMISYDVVYNSSAVGKQTVDIVNPTIVTDTDGFEAGKNYTIKTCVSSSTEGEVVDEVITTIRMRSQPTLAYEYGTPLDLDGGELQITYDSGKVVSATLEDAKALGIRIRHSYDNSVASSGDEITVKEHDGEHLIIDYPSGDSVPVLQTSKINVTKKDLHVTADDKSRYYGDANDTVAFTYSFTDSDFVYGDTKDTIGFAAPEFSCDATASTEVDKSLGYSEAAIVLTGGSSDNYNIVCVDGTLTINKRPLNVTAITAGVPALTAKDYFGKTAPFKVAAFAVAGEIADGETASMTVTNLYNNDPVKVNYNAQYASNTSVDSVAVTVVDYVMDDTYGKSYNYEISSITSTADGGRVYPRNIEKLDVITPLDLTYEYGTPLNLDSGEIEITYDSGEVYNVTFNEIADHDIKLTYSDTSDEVLNETHLEVKDTGRTVTLTPPQSIYEDIQEWTWTSEQFEITPHKLRVSPDEIYTVYGEAIPAYSYTYGDGDFQYGETEDTAVSVKPVIVCKEDDGTTEVNQRTLAGVYTQRISGGEADNYEFVYTNSNCTIRQRPLEITAIGDIPSLSATDAYNGNLSFDRTVETDKMSTILTFGDGKGLLWQDCVRISYTITYPDPTVIGETDVIIENATLDRTYGSARNYYLQKTVATQKGSVDKPVITAIEITADPTEISEGVSREYSYGDTLDLSGGRFKVTYDSGKVVEDVTLDKLDEHGITAVYTGTSDTVTDGAFATINYHNGKTITLNPPADATAQAVTTGEITVNKRKMRVIVNDATSIYGDTPSYTLDYTEEDFADGENALTAFGAAGIMFFAPTLSCKIDGTEAGVTTEAGTYTDAIKATGGSCENYEFVCEDTGTLTINKRELSIVSIDKSVPMLTTALIKENNSKTPITVEGSAANDDMTVDNLANNDSIGIKYNAVYNSIDAASAIDVEIKDVVLDITNYPLSKNYVLKSVPYMSAHGSIQEPAITAIEIKDDPAKMEYNYGESFELAGGSVDITYNDDYVINVSFDELASHGITLNFEKNGETVKHRSILTVSDHNGYRIKLSAENVESIYTGPMTVHKHTMRVIIEDNSFIYGETVPAYTYHYNSGDLVNGDSVNSDTFKANLVEPVLVCYDGSEEITGTSNVGQYTITGSGASSDNYEFEYVSGVMTVNKRPLDVVSINSGAPVLTKEIIKNSSGDVHRLSGDAENSEMTVSNLLDGDKVRITYTAVYNTVTPGENVAIDIENAALDNAYGDSNNYELRTVTASSNCGVISEREITGIEILRQPVLEYTYGDVLNLDSGLVRVTYNTSEFSEVTFNDLPSGETMLVYAGTNLAAANGDILNVPYHNSKALTIKTVSSYSVPDITTDAMVVNKKKLNVDADDVTSTYGENVRLSWTYRAEDFENGETALSSSFMDSLVEPSISCKDGNGNSAGSKTNVGEYTITVAGGGTDNYEFVHNTGTLTIERRPLDIKSIDKDIPILTSKIIYEEPGNIHRINGSAINTLNQMTVANVVNGDTVKINYTAVYTGTTPTEKVNVGIENVALDDNYAKSGNYKLEYVTMKSEYGKVFAAEISQVVITSEPKIDYTYGDKLDLSEGRAKIVYDSGYYVENVPFDQLASYGVTMTYAQSSDIAATGDVLNVPYHNGKVITLTPKTVLDISPAKTAAITVNKKLMDVKADKVSSIYGETPILTFTYDREDFVNNETPTSINFINGLVSPTVSSVDGEKAVDTTSVVGDYTVTVSGGNALNYEFVYHNNILTVERRPLYITAITSGVPYLTSDIIYKQPGEVHKLAASADSSQMTVENIVNNDLVRITYDAVYSSIEPTESIDVGIENAVVDDTYEQSKNYYVGTITGSAPNGRIYDREVTSVEIIQQPVLSYTYGEKLDLSGGTVRTVFDSGLILETAFNALPEEVLLTYTGTADTAADGDVLNVPYHNGKSITLTAVTVHDVEPITTEVISVAKRVLEYGECIVNPIIFDGSTTETTGTVVFANVQNDDTVTAAALFNFENHLAGENKTVYITDVKLDAESELNYLLAANNTTASGTIEKTTSQTQISDDNVVLTNNNDITITAPEMTQVQKDGGAEYEYSIDGGVTWQKSNIFENLSLGQDCEVCIRFAETDNYKQSEATVPVKVKTYLHRINLISHKDMSTLISFCTNTASVEKAAQLEELIGEIGVKYYGFYSDEKCKSKIKYPFEFTGDMTIYTSLKRPNSGGGSKDNSTPEPTQTPVPEATSSPVPTEKPATAVKNEPYISGYESMVRPDNYMTRAEAATIMVNLSGDTGLEYENIFPDVNDEFWYEKFISQGNARGLISGFDDGLFRPEDIVTREQFASMVARLIKLEPEDGEIFLDVSADRWSTGYISAVSKAGIVVGYADGTFLPENPITRAEAMRMVNVAINRIPDKEAIDKVECPYTDLPKTHWAYYEVMIASCDF